MENNNQFTQQTAAHTSPAKESFFEGFKTVFKMYPAQIAIIIVLTFIIASVCSGLFCAGADSDKDKDTGSASGQAVIIDDSVKTPDTPVSESTSAAETTTTTTAAPKVSGGKLGDYYVEIVSCRVGKKHSGEPLLFITYNFTNNSSEATSFDSVMSETIYQDGIQIGGIMIFDDELYDVDSSITQIKPGITIPVECAYELRSTTGTIEVEVTEWAAFDSDEMVTGTFTLS